MGWFYQLIILVIFKGLHLARGIHHLQGYDCSKPSNLQHFDLQSLCINQMPEQPSTTLNTTTITLLEYNNVIKFDGYSCQKIVSEFTVYCGAFSHQELAKIPTIEINMPVTIAECRTWITNLKYVNSQGIKAPLNLNAENLFYETPRGAIVTDRKSISCEGETIKFGNHVIDSIVTMRQTRINLKSDRIKFRGTIGESRNLHTKMPEHCRPFIDGCQMATATLIWDVPDRCSLAKIRTATGKLTENTFIDEKNFLRFELKGETRRKFPGCPDVQLQETNLEDIYIHFGDSTIFHNLEEVDVNIADYGDEKLNYVVYKLEEWFIHQTSDTYEDICKISYNQLIKQGQGVTWPFKNNTYATVAGEILTLFQCTPKLVSPIKLETCYKELPVVHEGINYFLTPISRELRKYGRVRPCNDVEATFYKTIEGEFISSNPELNIRKTPQQLSIEHSKPFRHITVESGGLYDPNQLEDWKAAREFEDFGTAMDVRITQQVCKNENCVSPQYIQNFDSSSIALQVPFTTTLEMIYSKLEWIGQICAIVVVSVWILQLIYKIVTCGIVCRQEGMDRSLDLCYIFTLKDYLIHREFIRNRRHPNSNQDKEDMEMQENYTGTSK